jgi:hypothetical protein
VESHLGRLQESTSSPSDILIIFLLREASNIGCHNAPVQVCVPYPWLRHVENFKLALVPYGPCHWMDFPCLAIFSLSGSPFSQLTAKCVLVAPQASSLKLRRSSSLTVSVSFFHRAIQCAVRASKRASPTGTSSTAASVPIPCHLRQGLFLCVFIEHSLSCPIQFRARPNRPVSTESNQKQNKVKLRDPVSPMSILRFSGE